MTPVLGGGEPALQVGLAVGLERADMRQFAQHPGRVGKPGLAQDGTVCAPAATTIGCTRLMVRLNEQRSAGVGALSVGGLRVTSKWRTCSELYRDLVGNWQPDLIPR